MDKYVQVIILRDNAGPPYSKKTFNRTQIYFKTLSRSIFSFENNELLRTHQITAMLPTLMVQINRVFVIFILLSILIPSQIIYALIFLVNTFLLYDFKYIIKVKIKLVKTLSNVKIIRKHLKKVFSYFDLLDVQIILIRLKC